MLREGLAGLLEDAGHEVVARVGDADALLAVVAEHEPDLAIIDVRMPPNYDDEGMLAAATIRREYPATAVLMLSQHIETKHALGLVNSGAFGYLLKDRVLDVDEFLDAARRVAKGGSALDTEVVASLMTASRARNTPLARAQRARTRSPRPDGRGANQRRHRQAAVAQREDRTGPRPLHPQ